MLVVLMNEQVLSPEHVCQSCLMATQHGQPRWVGGRLRCGRSLHKQTTNQPDQYECQMGFRIANIE